MLPPNEKKMRLGEAKGALKKKGIRRSTTTLWRDATRGTKGIRLECQKIGRTIVTSVEALERYFNRLADVETDTPATPSNRHDDAERELDAAGV